MSEAARSKTHRNTSAWLTAYPVALARNRQDGQRMRGRLHRETPFREKGAVYSTCTFYEQLLPMTPQQCPRQEGSEVHEDLPQQGGHLLQSPLQLCGDTVKEQRWKDKS